MQDSKGTTLVSLRLDRRRGQARSRPTVSVKWYWKGERKRSRQVSAVSERPEAYLTEQTAYNQPRQYFVRHRHTGKD